MTNGNALLIFRQLPVANGTPFFKVSKKTTTRRGIQKFFLGSFFFHSTLLPKLISRICWQMVPGNFCTMCRCFQVFESCGWMESAYKLPWEVPLFQVFFFSLEDHAANRNNSRGRAQNNYRLQTSFSNIKLRPKNVNHAQVFEVSGAPLTLARSPDKLSCKSEDGVGDKEDTFKARRMRAKIPYTLRFRALKAPIFWKGIKKLGSEPSTFYISLLSPLSFHVCGVCPSFYCCDL